MKQEKYDIIGMNTAACALRVEKTVSELPGVQNVNVNLLTNICELTYDEQVLDREDILLTVRKAGYDGELHNNGKRGEDQAAIKRTRQIRNRLIISVLLMLPLLYLTLYRYLDAWFHIAPPSWIAPHLQRLFQCDYIYINPVSAGASDHVCQSGVLCQRIPDDSEGTSEYGFSDCNR